METSYDEYGEPQTRGYLENLDANWSY
jgi:hypothetical protein